MSYHITILPQRSINFYKMWRQSPCSPPVVRPQSAAAPQRRSMKWNWYFAICR
ncbi:hypothetical protein CLOSTASPAR_05540 [[Clostridium] asparagiforme DSM 15981]|uniref:Uncharacterized protein n=1 Tax=[Clostridium] asparagiforme DSM 15981 TaxID=518636 RepID=C0D8E1_9FIRM|nr:hypothetical protein CLOSTASPAR_05540 [[Clostridium] asparagiforme DSM 15981]